MSRSCSYQRRRVRRDLRHHRVEQFLSVPRDQGNAVQGPLLRRAQRIQRGPQVLDDHLFVSPLLGYVNPADNKCATGSLNIGQGPTTDTFDPKSTFGHMHPGPADWWIVQVGQIRGRFENAGEFNAVEGDVLSAAPMSWHEMSAMAPPGPSVRLAMGGYNLINMQNTENVRAPRAPAQ